MLQKATDIDTDKHAYIKVIYDNRTLNESRDGWLSMFCGRLFYSLIVEGKKEWR